MKKFQIQVRNGNIKWTILRKVYGRQIGNFNPFFCRFNKQTFLVKSDEGDLSDPFRRRKDYSKSLFIELNKPCQWNLK